MLHPSCLDDPNPCLPGRPEPVLALMTLSRAPIPVVGISASKIPTALSRKYSVIRGIEILIQHSSFVLFMIVSCVYSANVTSFPASARGNLTLS